jgi:hypothetical protein
MVSSKMFEGYCADIESMLREGSLRHALKLALALPDICSALEDPAALGSEERYAAWCAAWLQWQAPSSPKATDGARLFRMHTQRALPGGSPSSSQTERALAALRKVRGARIPRPLSRGRLWQAVGHLQTLEVSLSEALVGAARRWYRDVGSRSGVVQRNLGRLAIMR